MGDRLTKGFIAGIVAGILINIVNHILFALDLSTFPFYYWSGTMILGHTPPFEIGETLLAMVSHLIFSVGLGIIFIYLIPHVTSKNLLFKGWIFGISVWFIIYTIAFLFKIEGILPVPLRTAVSDFILATIFGLVLAISIEWLTNKYSVKV